MSPLLRRLSGPLRRAWRVRGFGVHSPFAYAYLRSVIRPGGDVRYYAEDNLSTRRERLLYRIEVEAGPGRTMTLPDSEQPPVAAEGMRTYVALTPRSVAALRSWADSRDCGILFRSPTMAIYCMRPGIPRQTFEVAMP